MTTTVIKDAAWVIAWDEGASRQIFPTKTMRSSATAMSHMTGLYERSQAFSAPNDMARAASAEFAYCELLLSGVTSLVDISPAWNGWVELLAESGLRGFLAPGYASARWRLDNDYAVGFTWDEALGREAFAAALGLVDRAGQHPCRRLSGIVSPMQIDTCTAEPLRDSRDAARKRRLPFTVHVAQSVAEVQEMLHRHGKTPVQWADAIGILGPETILGHALFLDTHSWVRTDLGIIAESKVTTLDQAAAGRRLAEAQRRMLEMAPQRDYRGRNADQISPLSLPLGD